MYIGRGVTPLKLDFKFHFCLSIYVIELSVSAYLNFQFSQGIIGMCVCVLSHVQLFAAPWTVAHQVPLPMGFSRQEYWNGLPPPRDLPNPEIEPISLVSPALAGEFFTTGTTWDYIVGIITPLKWSLRKYEIKYT